MFIRLTKLDNTSIWINAAFVVTVEPRRGGGSIVVPIGDGLDYDVKEAPEAVLEALGDAPQPTVVPVPAPKGLTATPADVSPSPAVPHNAEQDAAPEAATAEKPTPVKKTTRSRAKKTAKAEQTADAEKPADEPAPEATKADEAVASEAPTEEKPKRTRTARKPKKPVSSLTDDQIARIVKMAPGSIKKLKNTLAAQFIVADADAEIAALEANGVFSLDRDHIIWAPFTPKPATISP